jgi:Tat protein translocase TatB subunit
MFGSLGGPEIVLILVVALIVFGPRKLPEIGKTVGKMLAEFRKASTEFRQTIEDEVEAERLTEKKKAMLAAKGLPTEAAPVAGAALPDAEAPPLVAPAEGAVERGAADAPSVPTPDPIEPR